MNSPAAVPSSSALPYRLGVGVMLMNREGLVFVAKRIDSLAEAWQMPQGGIDEGEAPEVAVFRELLEETGTDKAHILAESASWYRYDLPEDLQPRIWGGKYRGQQQKWYAMRFTGMDSDINIHTEEPEFCEWRWVPIEVLPEIIVPFKRQLYTELVAEFGHLIRG
jgi:putative (di)nucleoside polyphosphate hydrolase